MNQETKNNITTVEYRNCCGCGACYNKCPVGAISMQENDEGFLVPVVEENKCTNCGLCLKSCPGLNTNNRNTNEPECYAAMASDEIRMKSSSGGAFTVIAEYILDKGGYVCGAAYRKDWSVHHIIVDNKNNMEMLRKSKYILSETEKCYTEIKKLLENDKYVLFSGCPCQVAGLYSFLGKEYEKLMTVELLCHGAPNYRIFKKYLNEVHNGKKIRKLDFRDKSLGWNSSSLTIYHDGDIEICNRETDPYEKGFHAGLFNRKSCAPCAWAKLPRLADFTIADFWGIEKIDNSLNDGKGLSLLVVNNDKSKQILQQMPFKKLTPILTDNFIKRTCNVTLYRPLSEHHNRDKFFKNYDKISFDKNVKMCQDNKYDVCLVAIFMGMNYGSILVSFSVYKLIENLGYSVLMLHKPDYTWIDHPVKDIISTNFAQKYYNISKFYKDETDLVNLNNFCNTFVTGSDQIFNPDLCYRPAYLKFAYNYKNKIAFGTSFGHDKYDVSDKQLIEDKYLLSRFNHIALREKSTRLCNEIFNIEAEEIIDPTLILPKEEFDKLAATAELKINEPYLLTYTLDLNQEKKDAIEYIANKLNLKVINIHNLDYRGRINVDPSEIKEYTPEEFLYLYLHASFVFTDSYHGTCFSVKYNKPFVSVINNPRGGFRYKLFEMLGLNDRLVSNTDEIYSTDIIFKEIDYTPVNKIIEEKSKFAIDWLKNALKNNTSDEKFSDFENYQDIVIKDLYGKTQIIKEEYNQKIENLKNKILLLNRNKIKRKYYYYKIRSKFTFGKTYNRLSRKAEILHEQVRKIRELKKEGLPLEV